MVNPGAFGGSRKAFLEAQKELYAEAVANNHVADTVADIQRRYFKRYPITLPHNEEPSDEWLAQVDDSLPDPEIKRPEMDSVRPEDWDTVVSKYDALMRDLRARKDQIKRRLQYQYSKSRDESNAFERGASDPLAVLRARLTGITIKKPRMKTAYNLWGPENRCFVDPVFEQRVKDQNVPSKQQAALRSAIYKEMFEELPRDEQLEWVKRAEDEHQEALKDIERKMNSPPSTAPEDQQRIIQSLAQFVEPILDLIADHSGWKVTLIAGGPEPADAGRLNMVSIHSGVTSGSVKMNFGRSERRAYKDYIIPSFGTFLKKCYTIEECRARALPADHTATKLAALGIEEELDVHRFDVDPVHADTTKPYAFKMLDVRRAAEKEKRERERERDLDRARASKGNYSQSAQLQKENFNIPPRTVPSTSVKIGPPKGRKKQTLRTLPVRSADRDAPSVPPPTAAQSSAIETTLPLPFLTQNHAAPVQTSTSQALDLSSPTEAPSTSVDLSAAAGVEGHADTPAVGVEVHSDTPAVGVEVHSDTPAVGVEVHSDTPATGLSVGHDFPAGADDVSKVVSRAPTPIPSRHPTPEEHPAPTPSRQPTPAPLPQPILIQTSTSAPSIPSVQTSPLIHVHPSLTERAPSSCSQPTSTRLPPSCALITTPPGAATVPDFSSAPPAVPLTRSQKRKASEATESREHMRKKTRSSGRAEAVKRKASEDDQGPEGPKKKKQKGDAELTTPAFDVAMPQGCPAWIQNGIALVSSVDLGSKWQVLIKAWLKFEEHSQYKDTKLGTKGRPQVISDWIQRARPPHYRPNIKNFATYGRDFKHWWESLQPAWRKGDTDELQKGTGDWEALRRSGQNGVLSVVAGLFFWGRAAQDTNASMKAWGIVVDDVLYAFQDMV